MDDVGREMENGVFNAKTRGESAGRLRRGRRVFDPETVPENQKPALTSCWWPGSKVSVPKPVHSIWSFL
jgi:hypothetical protein